MTGPTIETVWLRLTGLDLTDELVEWPPDVFALTDVMLQQ